MSARGELCSVSASEFARPVHDKVTLQFTCG